MALGDAHRAVSCRPDSAAAHNTLGTVFQMLGQTKNARWAFERAVALDGRAAFLGKQEHFVPLLHMLGKPRGLGSCATTELSMQPLTVAWDARLRATDTHAAQA